MAAQGQGRASRLFKLLEDAQASDDVYANLTLLKTYCSRLVAKRRPEAALAMYTKGASALLRGGHVEPGYEVCRDLAKLLTSQKWPVNEGLKEDLLQLLAVFPNVKQKVSFAEKLIAWSKEHPAPGAAEPEAQYGVSAFHEAAALAACALGDSRAAMRYFVHASVPSAFVEAVLGWSKAGVASEADLFIARAVLTCTAEGNLASANAVFEGWLAKQGAGGAPSASVARPKAGCPADTPLVHFIGFMLRVLQRPAGPLLQTLVLRYKASLSRDASLLPLVFQTASRWFGPGTSMALQQALNPQQQQQRGFPFLPMPAPPKPSAGAGLVHDALD